MQRLRTGTLFLHYPCFDGLASAVLAADYLENQRSWQIDEFEFVNYDLQKQWLEMTLPENAAVVDFLYHPDALFWADHHGTTFVTEAARKSFEHALHDRTRIVLYDRTSPSCALLLWNAYGHSSTHPERFAELAFAANRIDAAVYDSVDEALFGHGNPAAEITLSLSSGDEEYGRFLLRALRTTALGEVAAMPQVQTRLGAARQRIEQGLLVYRDHAALAQGQIAVADVAPPEGVAINRYSPYATFPGARYSVTLMRTSHDARLTAMRNPWRDFESVDLGAIFAKYGGGGHQRVGSVVLREGDRRDPATVLSGIVEDIQRSERADEPHRISA